MGQSLLGGNSSQSQSTPQDLTPSQYVGLRPQISDILSFLMSNGVPQYNPVGSNLAPTTLPTQPVVPQAGGPAGAVAPTAAAPARYSGNQGAGKGNNPGFGGAGGVVAPASGIAPNPTTQGTAAGANPFNPAALLSSVNPGPANNYVAPITPAQTGIISQIVNSVQPGANPLMDAANAQLLKTVNGGYLPGQPGANPFLDAAIKAAQYNTQRQFQDTVVPGLLSRYTGGNQEVQGQGSSAFATEANQAALDYEQTQAGTAASMQSGAYTAERQNQIAAIAQSNQVTNDQLNRFISAGQAAALPQLVADLGIQRGLQQYNTNVNNILEILRIAGGLSSPTIASTATSSSNASPGVLGDLASAISGSTFKIG